MFYDEIALYCALTEEDFNTALAKVSYAFLRDRAKQGDIFHFLHHKPLIITQEVLDLIGKSKKRSRLYRLAFTICYQCPDPIEIVAYHCHHLETILNNYYKSQPEKFGSGLVVTRSLYSGLPHFRKIPKFPIKLDDIPITLDQKILHKLFYKLFPDQDSVHRFIGSIIKHGFSLGWRGLVILQQSLIVFMKKAKLTDSLAQLLIKIPEPFLGMQNPALQPENYHPGQLEAYYRKNQQLLTLAQRIINPRFFNDPRAILCLKSMVRVNPKPLSYSELNNCLTERLPEFRQVFKYLRGTYQELKLPKDFVENLISDVRIEAFYSDYPISFPNEIFQLGLIFRDLTPGLTKDVFSILIEESQRVFWNRK